MRSLDKRLDGIKRRLRQRNSPPPRLIRKESTREGVKYLHGEEPISEDELRESDVVIELVEDPIADSLVARWQEEALEENLRRDAARKREAELGKDEK